MHTLFLSVAATGSTVLQRLTTMVYYLENVKVQNTHDLVTSFLYNDEEQIIQRDGTIEYGQNLEEIQQILVNSNRKTKLVSRLSKDHLYFRENSLRKDDKKTQQNFIEFVKKFYTKIVGCTRDNVFEMSMSVAIKNKSDVFNITTNDQRKIVKNVNKVDESFFKDQCYKYIDYRVWLDKHFPNIIKISYEEVINNTDKVLYNLTGYRDTLARYFGLPTSELLRLDHKRHITNYEHKALELYDDLCGRLIKKKIFHNMPSKNTSLQDKKNQIENFDECERIFEQVARETNFIDPSISNFDSWHKKYVDRVS
jgi:hypothetical protein